MGFLKSERVLCLRTAFVIPSPLLKPLPAKSVGEGSKQSRACRDDRGFPELSQLGVCLLQVGVGGRSGEGRHVALGMLGQAVEV